jgi:hypothetical protein
VTVQIPQPTVQPQATYFTARPVEIREPAARTVTRTAVGSSRESQENRDDRNNRTEQTDNNRQAEIRALRAVARGGRGANVDIEA